jgi:hypothetical protein
MFRRLLLGFFLILATSGILLLSDLGSRESSKARAAKPSAPKRVAILQHASQTVLDDGRQGMIEGLAERGWHVGRNLELTTFNAEGDMPTAQTIAKAMVSGNHDHVDLIGFAIEPSYPWTTGFRTSRFEALDALTQIAEVTVGHGVSLASVRGSGGRGHGMPQRAAPKTATHCPLSNRRAL